MMTSYQQHTVFFCYCIFLRKQFLDQRCNSIQFSTPGTAVPWHYHLAGPNMSATDAFMDKKINSLLYSILLNIAVSQHKPMSVHGFKPCIDKIHFSNAAVNARVSASACSSFVSGLLPVNMRGRFLLS